MPVTMNNNGDGGIVQYIKDEWGNLKALVSPDKSIGQAYDEKNANINRYQDPYLQQVGPHGEKPLAPAAPMQQGPAMMDRVNPAAQYGDRGHELRPAQVGPASLPIKDAGGEPESIERAMPADRKKRSELPVYDGGANITGDMTTHWADPGGKSEIMGGELCVTEPRPRAEVMDDGGPHGGMELADAAPGDDTARLLQHNPETMSTGIPAEDNTSKPDEVDSRVKPVSSNRPDIQDGEHFPAVLMRGERVLTPQQNAEWMKDQHGFGAQPGAMTLNINMGGQADTRDTDEPETKMTEAGGALMPTQNSQANAPAYDSGGLAGQAPDGASPEMMPGAPEAAPQPTMKDRLEKTAVQAQREQLDDQMIQAHKDNDIVNLGMAAIGHQQLDKHEQRKAAKKVMDEGGQVDQNGNPVTTEEAKNEIPRPLGSGVTDHAGPHGEPPATDHALATEHTTVGNAPVMLGGGNTPTILAAHTIPPTAGKLLGATIPGYEEREKGLPQGKTISSEVPPAPVAESTQRGGQLDTTGQTGPQLMPTLHQVASTPHEKAQAWEQRKAELKDIIANSPDRDAANAAREELARGEIGHPLFHGIPRLLANIATSGEYSQQQHADLANARKALQEEATLKDTQSQTALREAQAKLGGFRPIAGHMLNPQEQYMLAKQRMATGEAGQDLVNDQQIVSSYEDLQSANQAAKPETKESRQSEFQRINALPEAQRKPEEQQYWDQNRGEFAGSVPVTKDRQAELTDEMAKAQARAHDLGIDIAPPSVLPTDTGDNAEKKAATYDKQLDDEIRDKPAKDAAIAARQQAIREKQATDQMSLDSMSTAVGQLHNYRDDFHTWDSKASPTQKAEDIAIIGKIIHAADQGEVTSLNSNAILAMTGAMAGGAAGGPLGAAVGGGLALVGDYIGKAFAPAFESLTQAALNRQISPEAFKTAYSYLQARQGAIMFAFASGEKNLRSYQAIKGTYAALPDPSVPRNVFDSNLDRFEKPWVTKTNNRGKILGIEPDYTIASPSQSAPAPANAAPPAAPAAAGKPGANPYR
jgi:hypothetical protein